MAPQDPPGDDGEPDEPTVSLGSDTPTTTGPAVASWSLEDLLHEPPPEVGPPVWREADRPAPPVSHSPAYYVSLTVAVMLVLGMIAGLTVLALNPPVSRVVGTPAGPNLPPLPSPTNSTPPGATTTTPPTSTAPAGEVYAELAGHPLSTATATMPEQTCELPTFDPADAAQAAFYEAAKVCADAAFGGLLSAATLPTTAIEVATVRSGATQTPCGAVEPTSPVTQCAGTVYMTPAHLRDVEGNDRYPGRYFGVFLREYARAVLETGGLGELYEKAKAAGAPADDLNSRAAQQATCLAGVASGAMAGRGAVDANITAEIRARLSEVDAPPDAGSWLDKGFQSRQLSACNSWN